VSEPAQRPRFGQRLATIVLLGALAISLLVSVPALHPVLREIRHMRVATIGVAIALEFASCVSFVVVFRLFFDRVAAREARLFAWTEMSSGALLPGGGVGGFAIGGWLMSLTGAKTDWIIRRSSGLFFLTTGVNSAAVIGSSILLLAGVGGTHRLLPDALPLLAIPATIVVVGLPWAMRRRRRPTPPWLLQIIDGIGDAQQTAAHPNWRLLGALGYLFFDIAVLGTTLKALGAGPSVPGLVLGYTIGYLASALPIPGGVGVLDAGLTGSLVLYGASPTHAIAAVLVYHAIAFWIPSLSGLFAYGRLRTQLLAPRTGLEVTSTAMAQAAAMATPNPSPSTHHPGASPDASSTADPNASSTANPDPRSTTLAAVANPGAAASRFNPAHAGGIHARSRPHHHTDPRRLGRWPDRRQRTRSLPRNRSQAPRNALPHLLHPWLTPARLSPPPPPRMRIQRSTIRRRTD
jgi:uncharacterized membrane protein YbhN (UPF0104 family)